MANNGQGRIFKRGNVWWLAFYGPDPKDRTKSKEFRITTGIKVETDTAPRACVALLKQYTSKIVAGEFVVNADKVTFETLVAVMNDDFFLHQHRSTAHLYHIKRLRPFFERVLPINYNTALYKNYQKQRRMGGASVATTNREMACLNRMLKLAFDNDLLPVIKKAEMLEGETKRSGFLNPGDFYRILEFLQPGARKELAEFLYLAGWRSGKATEAEWKHLDSTSNPPLLVPAATYAESTKGTGEALPLTGRLAEIIEIRKAERVLECPYIFHRNGKKIGNIRTAWYNACKRAGYGKILIHDFRRSMANNLDNAGVNRKTIMDRAGWKSDKMFYRYRIGSAEQQVKANEVYDDYIKKNTEAKVTRLDVKLEKKGGE